MALSKEVGSTYMAEPMREEERPSKKEIEDLEKKPLRRSFRRELGKRVVLTGAGLLSSFLALASNQRRAEASDLTPEQRQELLADIEKLQLKVIQIATLNALDGKPDFKSLTDINDPSLAPVQKSIEAAIASTALFIEASKDDRLKGISDITAVVRGSQEVSEKTPEPTFTPEPPKEKGASVPVLVTAVGFGFLVQDGKVYFYDNTDMLKATGRSEFPSDLYVFIGEGGLVAAGLESGTVYAKGKLADGALRWEGVGATNPSFETLVAENKALVEKQPTIIEKGNPIYFYSEVPGKNSLSSVTQRLENKGGTKTYENYGLMMSYVRWGMYNLYARGTGPAPYGEPPSGFAALQYKNQPLAYEEWMQKVRDGEDLTIWVPDETKGTQNFDLEDHTSKDKGVEWVKFDAAKDDIKLVVDKTLNRGANIAYDVWILFTVSEENGKKVFTVHYNPGNTQKHTPELGKDWEIFTQYYVMAMRLLNPGGQIISFGQPEGSAPTGSHQDADKRLKESMTKISGSVADFTKSTIPLLKLKK